MESIIRELETIKKETNENLTNEKRISQMNVFSMFNSKLETVKGRQVNRSYPNSNIKRKKSEKMKHRAQDVWDNIRLSNRHVIDVPGGERE